MQAWNCVAIAKNKKMIMKHLQIAGVTELYYKIYQESNFTVGHNPNIQWHNEFKKME